MQPNCDVPAVRFLTQLKGSPTGSDSAGSLGFESLETLFAYAEQHTPSPRELADAVVQSSLGHRPEQLNLDRAREILDAHPELTSQFLDVACVAADYGAVRVLLAGDSSSMATQPCGPLQLQPLLYVCLSRLASISAEDQSRQTILADFLLRRGADPNVSLTHPDDPQHPQSCLYGASGINDNLELTQRLLAAGADPNDQSEAVGPESLYHAAELESDDCLRAILAAGPRAAAVSHCLGRAIDCNRRPATAALLEHNADPNQLSTGEHPRPRLHQALANFCDDALVSELLAAGADVNLRDADGLTSYQIALRHGRTTLAEQLREHGVSAEVTAIDRFLSACLSGDRVSAEAILGEHPELIVTAAPHDRAMLHRAVVAPVRNALPLMLEFGFDADFTYEGMSALHTACWFGREDAVRAILHYDVDLEQQNVYGGTALTTAMFGSTHCHLDPGGGTMHGSVNAERAARYDRIVQMLLQAGADVSPLGARAWKLNRFLPGRDDERDAFPQVPKIHLHRHVHRLREARLQWEASDHWPGPTNLIEQIQFMGRRLLELASGDSFVPRILARQFHVDWHLANEVAARELAALMEGFAGWHDARRRGVAGLNELFEVAVEAVVNGRLERLETLLLAHPELVFMRSGRGHRATLLHYAAANGVEIYRQLVPPNHVEICELLLRQGAPARATCNVYGGGPSQTPLHLMKTSQHVQQAGTLGQVVWMFDA